MIDATEISVIVTATCTLIYTIGTFLLWNTTKRSVDLLKEEVKNQSLSNYSIAQHAVINAHRELYLEVIKDDHLIDIFSKDLGVSASKIREKFLATLLINHALRIFLDHKHKMADSMNYEGYFHDLKDLFAIPFVKKRWEEVSQYHPTAFKTYIDQKII